MKFAPEPLPLGVFRTYADIVEGVQQEVSPIRRPVAAVPSKGIVIKPVRERCAEGIALSVRVPDLAGWRRYRFLISAICAARRTSSVPHGTRSMGKSEASSR